MGMFKNEIKIDPNEYLAMVRRIEMDTVRVVIRMLRQESGAIPEFMLDKIAARYNIPSNLL